MQYFNFFFALLLITSLGCEQVDDLVGGGVDAPNVSYSATTLEADFYQSGSSAAPSISWNGDQGTISLATTVPGLSVNSTTGQLNWTEMLPPGTHEINVVVANSEGQVIVPVTIENPLSGSFTGVYDGSHYFAFDLMEDGTLEVRANSESDPTIAAGTWQLSGDEVRGIYTYEGDTQPYSFKGTIDQTPSQATLNGDWYYDDSFDDDQRGGDFETTYQ